MTEDPPVGDQPLRRIQDGDVVAYRYVIRSEAGQVLAASADIVRYIQGGQDTFPKALSSKLLGHHDGETFEVTLNPIEAFGPRDATRQVTLPREQFSPLLTLRPGMRLETQAPSGEEVSVWVIESTERDVVVDFEHPLAGQRLQFEIGILSIRVATNEERVTGRPSAPKSGDAVASTAASPKADSAPSTDLSEQLLELRRSLVERFLAEESAGNLHEGIVRRSYGNARQVQGMKDTHVALLDSLDGLAARVVDGEQEVDHRLALAALLQQIARHDKAESDLFQDSFQTDVGGEG